MKRAIVVATGLALGLFAAAAHAAEVPAGYPASYAKILDDAEKEGRLVIYANTEQFAVNPILEDFKAAFPKIQVDYLELKAADLYTRASSEIAASTLKADFIWSSAMDLQFQLADEGAVATYASVEKPNMPSWALYKDQLYGVTFEPVAIVYNKKLVPEADVPQTRDAFAKLLETKKADYVGKVAMYDPERSGLGFFVISHDARVGDAVWKLLKAMGPTQPKLYVATGQMLEKVGSGEHSIAYNIIGPYALLKAEKDPNIGIVMPKDYTQILTRIALIPKAAPHPNASKVFLDYLLSKRGQQVIADKALLYSIRADIQGKATAAKLTAELGNALKPIAITPALLDDLDPAKRLPFYKKFNDALAGK
ncbi:MAG: transporter substrate-binding protein [Rhodospirillales bacterium]|nr:transporter substrate-binding protein [Rhodospirillales bacterium]